LTPTGASCDVGNPFSTNTPGDLVPIRGARRPDDREFITSKEKEENDHPAALGMIVELCQRYPKTFTHEPHDVRPLARGTPSRVDTRDATIANSIKSARDGA
jgi:hypothetical protein